MIKKVLLSFLFFTIVTPTHAKCLILDSSGAQTKPKQDPLYKLLSHTKDCPKNYTDFTQLLKSAGTSHYAAMVANRGSQNPQQGSFSFFEMVVSNAQKPLISVRPGDFFFGHFTTSANHQIHLDQRTTKDNLMMELIVWDPKKNYYNFYELRGTGFGSQWFYRGDSLDALKDNEYLYRTPPNAVAKFGARMRCSACHNSGGPIMKEMEEPHNDWWRKNRALPFGFNTPDEIVNNKVSQLIDADVFSNSVKIGIDKLEKSVDYQQHKQQLSLPEQLRPLFCEVEINLASDKKSSSDSTQIEIPSAFFISPFFAQDSFTISKANYQGRLAQFQLRFPETQLSDADHAWLVPIKGHSDLLAIQTLLDNKTIEPKFAAAILATDMQNPLFSKQRCDLLQLLPAKNEFGWREKFLTNLKASSLPQAQNLYAQLINPLFTFDSYQQQAKKYVFEVKTALYNSAKQQFYFEKMLADRQAVFASEISQNSKGQILEPGFRVIFPEPRK
jgi:hypothetical protein